MVGLTGRRAPGAPNLALAIFGMTAPDRGTIRLAGLASGANRAAIAAGIADVWRRTVSTCGLALDRPVGDNLVATILDRLAGPAGLIPAGRRARAIGDAIARLAIKAARPEIAVRTLSGGNQQRVVLGKWLATGPRLLILDSPTVGVDGAKDGIYAIMRELAAEGLAILLISDEVAEVLHHTDRVLVMRAGRIAGVHRLAATSAAERGRPSMGDTRAHRPHARVPPAAGDAGAGRRPVDRDLLLDCVEPVRPADRQRLRRHPGGGTAGGAGGGRH